MVILVSGCATTKWYPSRPDMDEALYNRDIYECEKSAEASAHNWGSSGNPFMIANDMCKCMQSRGWIPGK